MIKNIYLILTLWISTFALHAQPVQPSTIGEVYNFEVGDTFIYSKTFRPQCLLLTACEQTTEVVKSRQYTGNNTSVTYEFQIFRVRDTFSFNCMSSAIYQYSDFTETRVYDLLDSSCFSLSSTWKALCGKKPDSCELDTVVLISHYNGKKSNEFNGGGLSLSHIIQVEGLGMAFKRSMTNCDVHENKLIYFHKVNEQPWSDGTTIINSIPDLPFQKISLYPTLVHEQFTVNLQGEVATKQASLMLYDGLGRSVMNKVLTEDKTVLDARGLGKGFYTWAIVYEGQQVKNGKLIIQ